MDKELKKRKGLITTIVILAILTLFTGYYAFKLKEQYTIMTMNNYNEAFSNLVNYMDNVENYLAKSMVTKSSTHAAETLTEIWRDSNLAMVYLSRIPLEDEGMSQTAKFLNQVSDYSYSLSRKNIDGEELSSEDFENIKTLHGYSVELRNTLNQLSEEIYSGEIGWDNLKTDSSTKFAQTVDNVSVFSNIDDNLNQYEGLIYDGAYSDHVNKAEKVGLTGNDISEEEAKRKVEEFFGKEDIENIENNGFIEKADIPCYDFSVKMKDKDENIGISISKKGGHVIQTETDREVKEEKLSQEEANQIGKEYLESKGFKDMKETYFMKTGNIVTINYAYEDKELEENRSEVICYPDLIKVKVALDNGEILGIETTGYLNSHTTRDYSKIKITLEDAKKELNEQIQINSEKLAIIPTEWKTEILCYEFKGKVEDKEFLVYINAETGKEEDVLVILDTPGGTLTM